MRTLNLVINCSHRKKAEAPSDLRLGSLQQLGGSARLLEWSTRLADSATSSCRVADLYAGDHWQVAKSILQLDALIRRDVGLTVCSAGYGLLPLEAEVKPYAATFSPGNADSVTKTLANPRAVSAAQEWWDGVSRLGFVDRQTGSVSGLASAHPNAPMIVVASEPYLLAMASDLLDAVRMLLSENLLTIVSVGARLKAAPDLQQFLLPLDARLEAVVGGTRTALNVRTARHLLRSLPDSELPTRGWLYSTLVDAMDGLEPVRRPDRVRMSDNQIREFISGQLRQWPSASKTALLSQLRDSGSACEQGRFARIFQRMMEGGRANGD